MKIHGTAAILTAVNLVLLGVTLVQARSETPEVTPVVRTRAFELVDEKGQVRSRLNVEPDGAVVLRLLDEKGTIRVKLAADSNGSGLVLLDETTEPGVHIVARRKGGADTPATRVSLKGAGGRERVIEPEK